LGIGDWGLGIGPNPQSPIPNPQSPIPNYSKNNLIYYSKIKLSKIKIYLIFILIKEKIKIFANLFSGFKLIFSNIIFMRKI